MCIRTVEGNDVDDDRYRTVSGLDSVPGRIISGIVQSQIVLAGTTPTTTRLNGPASGTYTTPTGCVYIEVYVVGAGGGGGGGQGVTNQKNGGGGGGGDVSFGYFPAGTYTYALHAGAAGGATGVAGSAAAQFSTFGTLKASGGAGGLIASSLSVNHGVGRWNSDLNEKNTLINFGYSIAAPPGKSSALGGYQLYSGYGGTPFRSNVNTSGAIQTPISRGGGGAGGTRVTSGGNGGPSRLDIIEYY